MTDPTHDDFARGRWRWKPTVHALAMLWCVNNARGRWWNVFEGDCFSFALRSDYEAFKAAFPREG